MSTYEKCTLIISGLALLLSIYALYRSSKADKISAGQIEISIHQLITQAKKDIAELTMKVAEQDKDVLIQLIEEAYERELNAYEVACAKYLDGKVDKERFKRNYHIEIRQLVEDDKFKKYDSTSSPYKCILNVYKEWNDLER